MKEENIAGPPPAEARERAALVWVNEFFYSLQGESRFAGRPCAFVRLSRCNLRCVWCDTRYTWTEEGTPYTIAEILEKIASYGVPLVEVTGGEPLLYPATPALLTALCDQGYTVLLETNGSLDIGGVDPRVVILYDIKPPGSGEAEHNRWANLPLLKPHRDEIKFVLLDRADYEWARGVVRAHQLTERHRVVFSPATPLDYPSHREAWTLPRELAAWILEDRLPVVLQLQLHRLLWPEVERGV